MRLVVTQNTLKNRLLLAFSRHIHEEIQKIASSAAMIANSYI